MPGFSENTVFSWNKYPTN